MQKHAKKKLELIEVKTHTIAKDQQKSIKGGNNNSNIVTEDLIDV